MTGSCERSNEVVISNRFSGSSRFSTLEMATAMFAETVEVLQQTTRLEPEK
jgi:hypothetical protein